MSAQDPAPFDRKMILAIGATIAIWVGYQGYLHKKYPDAYKQPVSTETATTTSADKGAAGDAAAKGTAAEAAAEATNADKAVVPTPPVGPEQTMDLEDDVWSLHFSSRGFGISNVVLKQHSDRKGNPVTFPSTDQGMNLQTFLQGRREPLNFNLQKVSDNQVLGEAHVGSMKITKIMTLNSAEYTVDVKIRVENPSADFMGLTTLMTQKVVQPGGSFLAHSGDHTEFMVRHENSDEHSVLAVGKDHQESYDQVSIAALAGQYFAFALVDKSKIAPEFKGRAVNIGQGDEAVTDAVAQITHSMINKTNQFNVQYKAFIGPKSMDLLKKVDADLPALVDFGFFQTIAVWIFKLLQVIQAGVGNWGVAIILLTVLVRAIVMPFNVMSYKSMRAMSKIQPQMKAIREKYKDEPQKANEEVMRLMKDAKANPLGGCLPMFLQIPVFFALYRVLGQSIELYKAPFVFWIHDLSYQDPYYVLPVLMGVTMFFQQKITPSTMDPSQQKILMFMPIFMTFLLATLPSGLTLYMFVSSLFGVLQQLYFVNDKKPVSN